MLGPYQVTKNPYIAPSFKAFFIDKWNDMCLKNKGKAIPDQSLGIIFAEAFAIFLNLINTEEKVNDTAKDIIQQA